MRTSLPQKRRPESERRRRLKWARFAARQKTRKYDPEESEQNHPYAHLGGSRLVSSPTEPGRVPGTTPLQDVGKLAASFLAGCLIGWLLGKYRQGPPRGRRAEMHASPPPTPFKAPPEPKRWVARPPPAIRNNVARQATLRAMGAVGLLLLPVVARAQGPDVEDEETGSICAAARRVGVLLCLAGLWKTTWGWTAPSKDASTQTEAAQPPAAESVNFTQGGECFHAEFCGHLRARRSRAYRPCLDCGKTGAGTKAPRNPPRSSGFRPVGGFCGPPLFVLPSVAY